MNARQKTFLNLRNQAACDGFNADVFDAALGLTDGDIAAVEQGTLDVPTASLVAGHALAMLARERKIAEMEGSLEANARGSFREMSAVYTTEARPNTATADEDFTAQLNLARHLALIDGAEDRFALLALVATFNVANASEHDAASASVG